MWCSYQEGDNLLSISMSCTPFAGLVKGFHQTVGIDAETRQRTSLRDWPAPQQLRRLRRPQETAGKHLVSADVLSSSYCEAGLAA